MLFSVEIRCGAEDLVAVMSRMREWLDAQRFEPDAFRHTGGEQRHDPSAIQGRKRGCRVRKELPRRPGLSLYEDLGPLDPITPA
jgi:hypothetical protein